MTGGTTLRLLADDLTGALDTAAQFTARHGAIPAYPGTGPLPGAGSFAIDGDTRAGTADAAFRKVREMAPLLAGGSLAMLKVDSLLRGHTVEEIGAAFTHGGFRSCVIAPAFPAQGRITEGGRQWLVAGGLREDVSGSLVTRLEAAGLPARGMGRALPLSGSGVFVCDAVSDADLDAIAAASAALEPPVLWCGSAGLARALGGGAKWTCCCRGGESALLIVGSGHANALAQLEEVQARWSGCTTTIRHPDDPWQPVASAPLSILQLAFEGTDAPGFLHRMRDFLANRLPGAPRPDTLIATGGDTLRAAIDALGATHLAVTGDFTPGIPVSRLCGGAWDGTTIISKSGAFGGRAALLGMVARALPEKPALARSRHAEGVAP